MLPVWNCWIALAHYLTVLWSLLTVAEIPGALTPLHISIRDGILPEEEKCVRHPGSSKHPCITSTTRKASLGWYFYGWRESVYIRPPSVWGYRCGGLTLWLVHQLRLIGTKRRPDLRRANGDGTIVLKGLSVRWLTPFENVFITERVEI